MSHTKKDFLNLELGNDDELLAHIVHCVNSHDALVEALRTYKAVLDTKEFKEAMGSRQNMQLFDAYCKAENALALAEKGAS